MIIKVCGLREADNISAVEAAGADWIGLIFYPKSPRYVPMIPSSAGIMPDGRPSGPLGHVPRAGVFVDAMPQDIITRVVNFGLSLVQLHGTEPPTYLHNLRATLDPDIRPGIKLIKALPVATAADLDAADQYVGAADYLLLDTRTSSYGGAGRKFDWDILRARGLPLPFLLSGGIGPDDAEAIARLNIPEMIGIDINSRFETAPAVKDAPAVKAFIDKIKRQ